MTPFEMVAATICALLVIVTLAASIRWVLGQAKDKPAPLASVVEAHGTRIAELEASHTELHDVLRRAIQRDAKARSRARTGPPPREPAPDDGDGVDDEERLVQDGERFVRRHLNGDGFGEKPER